MQILTDLGEIVDRFRMIGLLAALVVFSAACGSANQVSPTSRPQEKPTLTPIPVRTNPLAPSITASTTPTLRPSPSPTSTFTHTASPTATRLPCLNEGGTIERGTLRTDLLPLPLEYRVYLPPCYDQLLEQAYPVLYLIHGQNFNDDQWERLGMTDIAETLIAAEEIPPLIIVMPRDRSWSQPTEDSFGQVVVDQLLPYIDANYRTIADRDQRAIGGLSRGAGWALHIGFSRWDSFSAIGMHSLPVFWTDLPYIRDWLNSIPEGAMPRIYMDLGDKDRPQISRSAVWFEELLTEMEIPHEWHLYPGYHEEAYWQAHAEEYIRWYAKGW